MRDNLEKPFLKLARINCIFSDNVRILYMQQYAALRCQNRNLRGGLNLFYFA